MGAEVVGGLVAGSLALLADAGHMLSDAASLALALWAASLGRRPAAGQRTYGFYRAEILAALANGATLVAVCGFLLVEAVGRLASPPAVDGRLSALVAIGGLAVNATSLRILRPCDGETMNERGARLHVWSDLLGSVQAVLAGFGVWLLGWRWVDPAASLVILVLVLGSAWGLLREATAVLVESAPPHLDVDRVRAAMAAVPGVSGVHDLHVWTISSGLVALSAHVETTSDARRPVVLAALRTLLRGEFGIRHLTVEIGTGPCEDEHLDV